ncbi:hypothetical protein NBRC116587_17330 [Pseudoteredinibacter isoporae]
MLRCTLAYADKQCIAMNISALDGGQAFYLHGGFAEGFSEWRGPDLLMFEAISWAKRIGGKSFDFMSSPSSQVGLIKYKEKWGGVSRPQYTVDVYHSRISLYVFQLAMKCFEFKKRIWK